MIGSRRFHGGEGRDPLLSADEISRVMAPVYTRGDRLMLCVLFAHTFVALYWGLTGKGLELTLCIALATVSMFVASMLLAPRTTLVRISSGFSLQLFAILFTRQFPEHPEIFLYQFVVPVILILYEDWLAVLPCGILAIGQAGITGFYDHPKWLVIAHPSLNHRLSVLYLGTALLQISLCSCWAVLQRRRRLFSEWQHLEFEASNACLEEALLSSQEAQHELTEKAEMLKLARENAEEATRTQRDFLANMSHEIRTPMNGVLGMASMLLCSPLTTEQREFAETIRSSSEALLTLLNDILDMAKIQQGRMTLEPLPTEIRKLAEDIIVLLYPRAAEKNLDLVLRIAPDTPATVIVDSMRLRQVLLNLLSNAIKFTSTGHVVLDIAPVAGHAQAHTLTFSVSDTGIGIPGEKLGTIFDRFTQADSSMTRRFGGTGLGLAIAQLLVELLGGKISVESTVGAGSCFHFSLPLAVPAPAEIPSRPLTGKHIAVICSLPVSGGALCNMLEGWGASTELSRTPGHDEYSFPRGNGRRADAVVAYTSAFTNKAPFAEHCKAWAMHNVPVLAVFSNEEDLVTFSRTEVRASLSLPLRSSSLLETLRDILFPRAAVYDRTRVLTQNEAKPCSLIGTRVLVAEDNAVNRRVITAMLGKLGCNADLATTGLEAIKMWEPGAYDLILMDCQMPEMDGYEAAATIRKRERASGVQGTPIVALTANSMSGDREKCLLSGMDDHVAKPISLEVLRRAVERCLVNERGESVRQSRASEIEGRDLVAIGEPCVPTLRI